MAALQFPVKISEIECGLMLADYLPLLLNSYVWNKSSNTHI